MQLARLPGAKAATVAVPAPLAGQFERRCIRLITDTKSRFSGPVSKRESAYWKTVPGWNCVSVAQFTAR